MRFPRATCLVLWFQPRADAERSLEESKDRMREFGTPGQNMTDPVRATRNRNPKQRGEGKSETFNFLGFTHICGKIRKCGRFIFRREMLRKRLSAKLKELKGEFRRRRHEPVAMIGKWLRSVVQGFFNYHAVPDNADSLNSFRTQGQAASAQAS